MSKCLVSIVMGSDSDYNVMNEAGKVLKQFGISYDIRVMSAHRTPDDVVRYVRGAGRRGTKIFIAGAGGAAHLAGVVAGHTTLPVIGVPIDSAYLKGLDSLLSTVQMPGGVPVATVAIGAPGAKNAGLLSVEILALSSARLKKALENYRLKMAQGVRKKDKNLTKKI